MRRRELSTPAREFGFMQGAVVTANLTDAELVQRCRRGDAEAWNVLIERFSRYVYAICVQGFRLREQDAEDVFQEVFTRVYDAARQPRADDAAVRPWIAQLTRRLCLDRLAAGSREQPVEELRVQEAGADARELDEAFAVREALAGLSEPVPGDPRPLLHARRELPHDRRGARAAAGHDRQPHLSLPRADSATSSREEIRAADAVW